MLAPEENEPGLSAFDPEAFGPVVIIQLNRIYDVLMSILAETSPRGAKMAAQLNNLHEAGIFLSPPPAYSSDMEVAEPGIASGNVTEE